MNLWTALQKNDRKETLQKTLCTNKDIIEINNHVCQRITN